MQRFRVNPPQYQLAPESTRTPLVNWHPRTLTNSHPDQHARLPRLVHSLSLGPVVSTGQCWCRCQTRLGLGLVKGIKSCRPLPMWAPRQLRQSCRPRHARAGTGDLSERGVYVALTSWPRRGWLTSVLSLYDN